jgi:hypothetical protein
MGNPGASSTEAEQAVARSRWTTSASRWTSRSIGILLDD